MSLLIVEPLCLGEMSLSLWGKTQEIDQNLSDSTCWERDQTLERLQQLEVVSKTQENDKLHKHSLEIYTGDACESLSKHNLHMYQGTLLKLCQTLGRRVVRWTISREGRDTHWARLESMMFPGDSHQRRQSGLTSAVPGLKTVTWIEHEISAMLRFVAWFPSWWCYFRRLQKHQGSGF